MALTSFAAAPSTSAGSFATASPDGRWRSTAARRSTTIWLPIHGLLQAVQGWSSTGFHTDGKAAWVSAEFDVAQRADVLAACPFAHSVEVEATLRESALTTVGRAS